MQVLYEATCSDKMLQLSVKKCPSSDPHFKDFSPGLGNPTALPLLTPASGPSATALPRYQHVHHIPFAWSSLQSLSNLSSSLTTPFT